MAKFIVTHGIRIAKDFTPETFGRLTTLGPKFALPAGNKGKYTSYQICDCSCGNSVIVSCGDLKKQHTQSCGCLHRQRSSEGNTKHGLKKTPEYAAWQNMKTRCGNPNYLQYSDWGGRGIRVCDRWLDPEAGPANFIADMGPRPSDKHTIDRIDNDGDYCPENCRWATRFEQNRNQRSNVMLTHNNKTQCVADWARELSISKATISYRIKAGWTAERALTVQVLESGEPVSS
jgi:hypothetical protein